MRGLICLFAFLAVAPSGPVLGQDAPFGEGWVLVPAQSSLSFLSTKNVSVTETNRFTSVAGSIDPAGEAMVKVQLNSIDTGIDLRNVRMRYLFFETFKFPEMAISARIDPDAVADLEALGRKRITVPVTVDLHGITRELDIEMSLSMLADGRVSVASAAPIAVQADLFGFEQGVERLAETAGVDLVPAGTVSFDLVFEPGTADAELAAIDPRETAVETEGNLNQEECVGRFEVMSQAEAIFFETGSARLDEESRHMLDEVIDIVERCPGLNIEVSGHTDSRGSEEANQELSERRADSVHDYLVARGIGDDRMHAEGFGETQPAFPNDSERNRSRNRRIEFSVLR